MAKLTLANLANLNNQTSAVNTINNNSDLIETALENTLSRDGTAPNSMGADLDMNGKDILNVGNVVINGDILTGDTVTEYVEFNETSVPSSPATNSIRLYALDNGGITTLQTKDSAGTTSEITHFKQTGTGAAVRTQQSKLLETVSVKDFGAVADNSTSDVAAFQATFTAAIASGKAVHIPAGTYFLGNTSLTWTNAPCRIYGDGLGVTVLRWNGSSGGIAISQNNEDYFTFVGDLSLWQSGANLGVGLSYDGSGQKSGGVITNRTSPRLLFSNLAIRGTTDPGTDGWNKHIVVNNGIHVLVDRVHIEGKFTTTQPNIQSASGFHFYGDGSPVEIVVSNSWAFYVLETVLAEDCEGVFVDHCNFVAVGKGVNFNPSSQKPQLCVTNSHINAYTNCIKAVSLAQGQILNNLLYSRSDATSNATLVLFGADCDDCHLSSNTLVKTSANTDTGIDLGGASGSTGNRIHGNILLNLNVGVSIAAGSTGTQIFGNRYTSVGTPFTDAGTSSFRHHDDHDGTAALPAWTFKGDENTGVYRVGADSLGISTGGVKRVTFDSSFQTTFGAAANTETVSLEVGSGRSGNGASFIDINGEPSADYGLRTIRNSGANAASLLQHAGTGTFSLRTDNAAVLSLETNATAALSVGADQSVKAVSPTGGLGYGTGAGGTVTQATSKSTGVTLNKACGQITMNGAILNAGTIVSFVLTDSAIAATDVLILNHISGGTIGSYTLNAQCAAGSATINVRNATAGNLTETPVLQFAVIKAINA